MNEPVDEDTYDTDSDEDFEGVVSIAEAEFGVIDDIFGIGI